MPGRRGKPRSDDDIAEDAKSLPVLDLDDPEVGIRPEDRFAAIPPGPRLVPRRVHDDSPRAPVVLLAGLLVVFLVGSWLGGMGSGDGAERPRAAIPVLDHDTGASLLLVGEDSVAEIDVGRGGAEPAVGRGARTVRLGLFPRSRIVPSATAGRAWIVEVDRGWTARELDLDDASWTAHPLPVEGAVVGATELGLVVERPSGVLEAVGLDGLTVMTLSPSGAVLGTTGTVVATRADGCAGDCPVVLTDVAAGTTRELVVDLPSGGTELGSLSPDGHLLAVARSDGVDTRGVLVDVELGTRTPFRARAARRDAPGPVLAWSADTAWLFLATERDGLDVVATGDGTNYRVDEDLPPFTAILTR